MQVETKPSLTFKYTEELREHELLALDMARQKIPGEGACIASFRLKENGVVKEGEEVLTIRHSTLGDTVSVECAIIKDFGLDDGMEYVDYDLFTNVYNVAEDGKITVEDDTQVRSVRSTIRTKVVLNSSEITGLSKRKKIQNLRELMKKAVDWKVRKVDKANDFLPPLFNY